MALSSPVRSASRQSDGQQGGNVVRKPPQRRYLGRKVGYHIILILICLAFLVPFAVMITTAFKTPQDVFRVPPRLLPEHWVLSNFVEAVQAMPFLRYLAN